MEEGEREKQFLVCSRVPAVVQLLVVETFVVLQQILTKTSWWLHCHFNGGLQDCHRECRRGHRSEPDSEVWVVCLLESVHNGLEFGHPRNRQVTVLQENPPSFDHSVCDLGLSLLRLALTK